MNLSWRYATGGKIRGQPVVAEDGTVYIVSEDRYLHAIAPDGRRLWRTWLGERVSDCFGMGYDGTLYVGFADGKLGAYNKKGDFLWKREVGEMPVGDPVFHTDGTLFIPLEGGSICAVSHTGLIRWRVSFDAEITDELSVVDDIVYCSTMSGKIYAISRWSSLQWIYQCSGIPGPAVPGPGNALYIVTDRGHLISLDFDGRERWNRTINNYSPHQRKPLVSGMKLYIPLRQPFVSIFDQLGNVVGQKAVNAEDNSALHCTVDADGTLYYVTEADRKAGRATEEDIRFGTPVLSSDGSLYVAGGDWVLYAFSTDAVFSQQSEEFPENDPLLRKIKKAGRLQEDEYETNMDYLHLKNLVTSFNRTYKEMFIDEVEDRVRSGTIGASEEYVRFLLSLIAGEGTITPYYSREQHSFRVPDIQHRAIMLLGTIGTFQTMYLFETLMKYEYDESILTALIDACGRLGVDSEKTIVRRILFLIEKDAVSRCNDSLARAAIDTCKKIAAYRGYPDDTMRKILFTIFKGNYNRSTRESALSILETLVAN